MPLQKRRMGPARIHHRRSSWMRNAFKKVTASSCTNCGEPRIPHRVCMSCGFYKDRVVAEMGAGADEE